MLDAFETAAHNDGCLSFPEFALFLSQQHALPEYRILPKEVMERRASSSQEGLPMAKRGERGRDLAQPVNASYQLMESLALKP